MKKVLSTITAFIILLTIVLPIQAMASEPYVVENPLYSNTRQPLLNSSSQSAIENSVSKKYKGKTYNTCGKQLYIAAKKQLENRKNVFDLYCTSRYEIQSNYQATNNILTRVFYGATEDELSSSCIDGDYIRWAVSSWSTDEVDYKGKKDGYYFYVISAHFNYYDTLSEENKVDSVVNSFVNSLNTSGKSDEQIIKSVHDFICKRTTYDYAATTDPYSCFYAFSSYGALVKGKSVCQGYASAFYRICKELGYNVRFVSSDPDSGCHAWNIIELDGKYYIVDCTWDDEAWDEGASGKFGKYSFFLVNYDTSKKYDSSYREHTLDSRFYGTGSGYFFDKYYSKYSKVNYSSDNKTRLSGCNVSLSSVTYTYSGEAYFPSVEITDGERVLKPGEDFTLKYVSNVNSGMAEVRVNGMGDYDKTETMRRFTIRPAAASNFRVAEIKDTVFKFSWTAAKGNVSGYLLQTYDGKKWRNLTQTSSNYAYVDNLLPAQEQNVRVLAYKTVSKRNIYSKESNSVLVYTKPSKVKIRKAKSYSKSFKVDWKKTEGSGYQLQYSLNKNMKGAKTININGNSKTSRTVKKLKKKKKYYVRVRAYKRYKINGKTKTYYGNWSSKKTIKTK